MRDEYRASRVWHIVEAALEYFISILVTGAYLARVTASLGFSDSLTGILSSFVSLGCVFQLGGIALFRGNRPVKRPILLCQAANELLFALVYLVPVLPLRQGQKTALFICSFCAGFILMNLIRSRKTAWMMSLVADRARGIYSARLEIVSLIGGMFFTYTMGSLIDALELQGRTDQALVAGAAAILVLAALHIVTMALVKEKPPEAGPLSAGPRGLRVLLRDRMLRRIVLVGMLWYVAAYSAAPYYGPYQIKELGFSMTFISILAIVSSVVRAAFSPFMGRYADRHSFSHMIYLCFIMAAAGFLVNCFTVPENGKLFFMLHTILYGIALAGINSAMTNLVLDYVRGADRSNALAVHLALSGAAGFLATCVMSPLVALIQRNGNSLLGLPMYPAQFVSAVAFLISVFLVFFVRRQMIAPQNRA